MRLPGEPRVRRRDLSLLPLLPQSLLDERRGQSSRFVLSLIVTHHKLVEYYFVRFKKEKVVKTAMDRARKLFKRLKRRKKRYYNNYSPTGSLPPSPGPPGSLQGDGKNDWRR